MTNPTCLAVSGACVVWFSVVRAVKWETVVAAVLYVAVNDIEPNRRHAIALKALIIALAVVANRQSFDAIVFLRQKSTKS
jgi:hypothetical protein